MLKLIARVGAILLFIIAGFVLISLPSGNPANDAVSAQEAGAAGQAAVESSR